MGAIFLDVNDLEALSVKHLAAIINAALIAKEKNGLPFLYDDEFVGLYNDVETVRAGGNSDELIKSVEDCFDDEVAACGYRGLELLDRAGGVNADGDSLNDCLWYSINPSTGAFDWSNNPYDLKVVRPHVIEDALDEIVQDDELAPALKYEILNGSIAAIDGLIRFLNQYSEDIL